jgi:hypothetical protein
MISSVIIMLSQKHVTSYKIINMTHLLIITEISWRLKKRYISLSYNL